MTFEVKIYVKKGCIEWVSNLEKVVLPESVGGFPANLHLPPACVPQPTEIIHIHWYTLVLQSCMFLTLLKQYIKR